MGWRRHRPVKVGELAPGDVVSIPGSGLHWVEGIKPVDGFLSIDFSSTIDLDPDDVLMILDNNDNDGGDEGSGGEVAY